MWHTEISTDFMYQIIKGEEVENLENILIPTIILHDIGWSKVDERKNISYWESDMRVKHMEEGGKIARNILQNVNYDWGLIEKVCNLVSTHDNFYLGKEQVSFEEKLVRDADACFILTELSFWKDYYVTTAYKGVETTPKRFLNKQVAKYSKRNTRSAQDITDRQVEERSEEIKGKLKSPEQRYNELKKEAEKINQKALKSR